MDFNVLLLILLNRQTPGHMCVFRVDYFRENFPVLNMKRVQAHTKKMMQTHRQHGGWLQHTNVVSTNKGHTHMDITRYYKYQIYQFSRKFY